MSRSSSAKGAASAFLSASGTVTLRPAGIGGRVGASDLSLPVPNNVCKAAEWPRSRLTAVAVWQRGRISLAGGLLTIEDHDVDFYMVHSTLEAVVPGPVVAPRRIRERGTDPQTVLLQIPEVEALADRVVASWHSSNASLQSRRWHRAKFDKPLRVTPLDDLLEVPAGVPLAVVGHDISLAGLSFIHDQPLAARKVSVAFQLDDGTCESVLTLLKWCRFRRDGLYQSGGQFVRRMAHV